MARDKYGPVTYSRKSWAYRRWLAYNHGNDWEPRNSCEYRSVVYFKTTFRQLGLVAKPIVSLFRRKHQTKPQLEPKPVVIKFNEPSEPPRAVRMFWTVLWPVRKVCWLVGAACYHGYNAVSRFNDEHSRIAEKVWVGLLTCFAVAVVVAFAVMIVLEGLLAILVTVGVIASTAVLILLLTMFVRSDLPATIGDLFTSVYEGVCRQVQFKD